MPLFSSGRVTHDWAVDVLVLNAGIAQAELFKDVRDIDGMRRVMVRHKAPHHGVGWRPLPDALQGPVHCSAMVAHHYYWCFRYWCLFSWDMQSLTASLVLYWL